jgi:predicted transcriptional regulator
MLTSQSSMFLRRSSISAFVEVFVCIDDQTSNGFTVADQGLHLGEEGILELPVCIALVAELQH